VWRSNRDDSKDRDFYGFINRLIAEEGIDIFAFQEAKNINFVKGLRRNLPPHWMGESLRNSELAFVWNSERVEECSRWHGPRIFVDYSSDIRMDREPAYGRFAPIGIGPNVEFRLVNIHIKHGGDDLAASIETRKLECGLAKGVIYQTVDKPPMGKDGNFRSIFTVVLGDYNLDCDTCNDCGLENVRTFQDAETTLKEKEPGYKNSYDHFSYDAVNNSSVPFKPSRIDAVKDYFNGEFTIYRQKISDHVPVKLEIY
jgi:hypothetical protein